MALFGRVDPASLLKIQASPATDPAKASAHATADKVRRPIDFTPPPDVRLFPAVRA
jgi:hypothetical protein